MDSNSDNINNKSNDKALELFDIPSSDTFLPKKTKSDIMLPVSIENQQYIAKCFAKYGNDYEKNIEGYQG